MAEDKDQAGRVTRQESTGHQEGPRGTRMATSATASAGHCAHPWGEAPRHSWIFSFLAYGKNTFLMACITEKTKATQCLGQCGASKKEV